MQYVPHFRYTRTHVSKISVYQNILVHILYIFGTSSTCTKIFGTYCGTYFGFWYTAIWWPLTFKFMNFSQMNRGLSQCKHTGKKVRIRMCQHPYIIALVLHAENYSMQFSNCSSPPLGPSTTGCSPAVNVYFSKYALSARTSDSFCSGFQHWMTQGKIPLVLHATQRRWLNMVRTVSSPEPKQPSCFSRTMTLCFEERNMDLEQNHKIILWISSSSFQHTKQYTKINDTPIGTRFWYAEPCFGTPFGTPNWSLNSIYWELPRFVN